MSRVCYFTGKKPRAGKTIARRGISKRSGGIGLKTTGISTRRFLPNLQTVKIVENGRVKRVRVSASFLKKGTVRRAPKRNWKSATKASADLRPAVSPQPQSSSSS